MQTRDPWMINDDERGRGRPQQFLSRMAVVVLGASGPVLELVGDGPSQRRSAAVLLLGSAVLVWVLRSERLTGTSRSVLALAVVAGSWAITLPEVGRAPAAIMVVGTMLADTMMFRTAPWSLTGSWPPGRTDRHRQVATLAIPFAVFAQVSWVRSASPVRFVALAILVLLVVSLQGRFPDRADRMSSNLRNGVGRVAASVGVVVVAIVALPLLYLPGAVGNGLSWLRRPRARWDDVRVGWSDRPTAVVDHRRESRFTFAAADPRQRSRRNRVALVGLVGLVGFVAWRAGSESVDSPPFSDVDPVLAARYHWTPFTANADIPYSERAAYQGDPIGNDIQRDQAGLEARPHPVGGDRLEDHATEHVNVRDGARMTLEARCQCPRLTVWFFGGSAAFGIGQRDEHTVASELVRIAEADGVRLEVRNFGAPAWTLWQEYEAFAARLIDPDERRPDIVVFYDGFNDAIGAAFEAGLYGLDPDRPTLLANADVWRFVDEGSSVSAVGGGRRWGWLQQRSTCG